MALVMSSVHVSGAPSQLLLASDFHMPPVKTTSDITIEWSHATCSGCTIASYTVEWRCSPDANDAGACASGTSTSTQVVTYNTAGCLAAAATCQYTFSVSPDTAYDFRIKSSGDDASESAFSEWLQGDGQYCRTSSFDWVPDCTAGCFFTHAGTAKVPPQPPTPTTSVVTSTSASKSVSLGFDVPGCSALGRTPEIDSYKIKYFKVDSGSASATSDSTTLSYTDNELVSGQTVAHSKTGLDPNTNYTFSVVFVNDPVESTAAGETESDPVTVLTDSQAPGTFAVSRQASTDTSLEIGWPKPANYNAELEDYVVSYCAVDNPGVEYCLTSGTCTDWTTAGTVSKACTGTSDCRFTMSGLSTRRRYRFRVQATNNPGGDTYKYVNLYTEGLPYAVGTPATGTVTRYSIPLTWSRPNDCTYSNTITEYELYIASGTTAATPLDSMARSTSCATPPCVLTLAPATAACSSDTGCAYTHDSLSPLETFSYFVRAQNGYGWGGWSAARTATTSSAPPAFLSDPTTAPSPPSETQMEVQWDEAEGYGYAITEYEVSVCNGASSASCDWDEGTVDGLAPSARAYNWTGLSGYQPYIFRLRAKSGYSTSWGTAAYSAFKRTVDAPAQIDASTIAHKAAYGTVDAAANLYFEWTAPSTNYDNDPANLRYEARIADFGSSSFAAAADASVTTEHTFSGRAPNTTYLVQVRATNSWDTGDWSASQALTTGGKIPDAFTAGGTSASTTTNASLTLTWAEPGWNNAPQVGQYTVTWWRSSSYNSCTDANKVAGTEDTHDTSARSMALPGTANGDLDLSAQTTYCFSVEATSTAGSRSSRPSNTASDGPRAIITEGVPATPSTPTEGSKDMYTIQVSWTRPADYHYGTGTIDEYEVYIADGASATATVDASADSDCATRPCVVAKTASQASCASDTSCNHLHSNLQPQETYSYSVRAHNPYGWSAWSAFKEITTTDGTPSFGTDAVSFPGPQAPSYLLQAWTEPTGNGNAIVSYDVSISGVGCCSSDCYSNSADCCNGDWTDVSGLDAAASSGAWDHSSRSYNHSGLSRYTCYNFRVRATSSGCTSADCTGEWRYSQPKRTVDDPGVPSAVDHKRTSGGAKDYGTYDEHDTLLVAWAAPARNYDGDAAMSYEVRLGSGAAAEDAGAALEHALTGLSPNTSYPVSVRAQNSWGWGEWTADVELTTGGRIPSTFTWSRSTSDAADITDTRVTINWASPTTYNSPLTGGAFTVYWCESTICPTSYTSWTSVTVAEVGAGNTEYALTGLSPQTAYRFKVEAATAAGSRIACACSCTAASSCDSSGVVTEGKPATPVAPVSPDGSVGPSTIQVSWSEPEDYTYGASSITRYQLNVSGTVEEKGATERSHIDSDLEPLTNRTYSVRAYNSYGWSDWSETTSVRTTSSAPTLDLDSIFFVANEGTNTTVTPKWRCIENTNDGCDAYGHTITNFHVSMSNAGCCDNSCYSQQNGDCCAGPWTADTTLDSHIRYEQHTGLDPYTCYVFRVRVRSDGFPDEPGAYVYSRYHRTVDSPDAVDATTIAKKADYGSYDEATDLYVEWTAPARRSDYRDYVAYEVRLDGNSTALDAGDTAEFVFGGLEPNTTHTVAVRMRNSWGWADWSDASTVVTGGQAPDGPATSVAETTNTSLRVVWDPPESYNSARRAYTVYWCQGNHSSGDSCDWKTSALDAGDDVSQRQYELPNAEFGTPLLPETDYLLVVEASNGFGRTNGSTLLVHTAGDPERPAIPFRASSSSTAIQVGWYAPEDHNATVTSYQVNVSGEIKTVAGTRTRYLDDGGGAGLQPQTTRTYNVRAENAYGWSPWSPIKTITTSDAAPTLALDAISFPGPEAPYHVVMRWSEADGHGNNVTGYDVSISNEGCCSNACYGQQADCCSSWSDPVSLGEDVRQHNFSSLNPDGYKCYVFRVRGKSVHEDSPGGWTYSRRQRTVSDPGPVDSATVVEKDDYGPNYDKATHLYIEWDAAPRRYDSNAYVSHRVRIDGRAATNVFGSQYSSGRSFVVPNLQPNTSYQVSVLTRNTWAWSDEWSANATLHTDVGEAPEQCQRLRRGEDLDGVSNVSTFRLVWAACDDNGLPVSSHDLRVLDGAGNVLRSSLGIGSENEYVYDCGPEGPCDSMGCRCEPETTRVFQVRAVNSQGASEEWSNAVNLTSDAARGPETPNTPVQKAVSNYWWRLSWLSILWDEPYSNGMPIEEYEVCIEAPEQWYGEYGDFQTRGALPSSADRTFAYVDNGDGTTIPCNSSSPRCCVLRDRRKKAWDVQSLKMNESRVFTVASKNVAGWSSPSAPVEYYTDPPEVPRRMSAVTFRDEAAASNTQRCNYLPVQWTQASSAGAPIEGYQIMINETTNQTCRPGVSCAADDRVAPYGSITRAADLGRYMEGSNLTVYIRGSNWYGAGEWSTAFYGFTIDQQYPPKPAPPTKVDLDGVSNDTAISVTWSASTRCADLDLAELEVCEIGAPADQEPCSYINTSHRDQCTNAFTKSPLTPKRRYTFRVRVHNYLGWGSWSELSDEYETAPATAETERVCERVEQDKLGNVPPTPTVRNFTWLRGACSSAPPSEPCDADTSHTLDLRWTVEDGGDCAHPDVESFDASFRGTCLSALTTVLIPVGAFSCAAADVGSNVNHSYYNATIAPATLTRGGLCEVEVAHLRSVSSTDLESLSSVYEVDPNATDTASVSQPPEPPATRDGAVTTTTLNVSWAAAVSVDAPIAEYLVSGDFGADVSTTGDVLSVLIEGLAPGADFTFRVAARNGEGWGDASAERTSHTLDTPDATAASSATGVAHADMVAAIFASWALATDHGSPLEAQQLRIDGDHVVELGANATSYTYDATASGGALDPAQQHKFELRALNGVGWGAWGPASYLWTDPDVPATDGAPVCSVSIASAADFATASQGVLVLELPPATDHGSDVTSRQLSVVVSGASLGAEPAEEHDANSSSVIAVVGGVLPSTAYDVKLRTANGLGWSDWSTVATCTSTGTLAEVESAITVNDNDLSSTVIIPIAVAGFVILLAFCAWFVRRLRQRKSVNRKKFKTRKVVKKGPTKEVDEDSVREERTSQVMPYMTNDLEPGVDDSREINYNPVLLHQMEQEARRARDAKRANAKGGGGGFMGTSGAVKKLKLGIEKEKVDTGDGKSREGKKLDEYLSKSVGVSSDDLSGKSGRSSKDPRSPGRGGKGAKAPHSELQDELDTTRAHAAAREQARAAMKKKKSSEFGINVDVGEDSPVRSGRSGLSKEGSRGSIQSPQGMRNSMGGHCNVSEKL